MNEYESDGGRRSDWADAGLGEKMRRCASLGLDRQMEILEAGLDREGDDLALKHNRLVAEVAAAAIRTAASVEVESLRARAEDERLEILRRIVSQVRMEVDKG